jgi:hypothetical protein
MNKLATLADSKHKIGFKYEIEVVRDGEVVDSETVHNLIPDEGVAHILNAVLTGGTRYAAWYVGIFEGNYTPVVGDTMALFVAGAVESTPYTPATRPLWVPDPLSAGALTNTTTRAEFTMTTGKTIYGGFLSSSATKQATTGPLLSAARFSTAKVLIAGDILRVVAGITLVGA